MLMNTPLMLFFFAFFRNQTTERVKKSTVSVLDNESRLA